MSAKPSVLLQLILFSWVACNPISDSQYIHTADSLLWTDPDSCICFINTNEATLTQTELYREEVIYQHAYLKLTREIADSVRLAELISFSEQHELPRLAGEAYYILGAYNFHQNQYYEATICLKQAEEKLLQDAKRSGLLLGMVYFYLGGAAEQCRLFMQSNEYYAAAIPYLQNSRKPLYLSACYHHLAKSCTDLTDGIAYIDSALYYAQYEPNIFYYKEIETLKLQLLKSDNTDSVQLLRDNIFFLCDSCHAYSYAADIVSYYITEHDYQSAMSYLNKLALDTATNIWSAEHYHSLKADLLFLEGDKAEAYNTLRELHQQQTSEIERSAYVGTYIISQKYEAAKEQEMRLEEQVKKQRAYLVIVLLFMVCFSVGGGAYLVYKRSRFRLQLSEEQKKRLEQELQANRAMLRTRISERLQAVRDLYQWSSHHSEKMPDVLGNLSPKRAAMDARNWKAFYDEFNLCYGNMLQQLKDQYPALTESDLQYIALTFLQFDITDIGFLLGLSNRTVWNRRNLIKRHLNMPDESNLDEWILRWTNSPRTENDRCPE